MELVACELPEDEMVPVEYVEVELEECTELDVELVACELPEDETLR